MEFDSERYLQRVYDVRMLFNAEWIPAVFVALLDGPKHYKEILAKVRSFDIADGWTDERPVIHEKVLSQTLQRMAADGLLIREERQATFPRSVVYSLTDAAREVLEVSAPTAEWAERHRDIVLRAQQRRRRGDE